MKKVPAIQKHNIKMDKCVVCGKETEYVKNMHTDYRNNYVDGAGQLCEKCANKIYKEN